ncbi:carbohydrate kinase family protein [Candidatus Kaiserbacteria bacterium]|nr:carbohydrate kinase family protein [Candidatus Kaiserbacteria bacterium]
MQSLDFIAIGDTTVDEFIELEDASVHCDINNEECTISMRWGDKIPFKGSTLVPGVGNAANAAVSAARLGLRSGFVSNIGTDRFGDDIMATFTREALDTSFITRHKDVPTNHHYVLSFHSERTILIKHEAYPYRFPGDLPEPKTIYFSSIAGGTESYHDAVAEYLEAHPNVFFAFQPGTFQMKMGAKRLERLYRRADLFVVNKEEAERVLEVPETPLRELAEKLHALGPKIVIVTDGRNGVSALHEGTFFHLDMYPDIKPPVNRTGAGDAFSSTTAAYLTMGMPLKDAMIRGTINSAYVVQKVGAQAGLLSKDALEAAVIGKK